MDYVNHPKPKEILPAPAKEPICCMLATPMCSEPVTQHQPSQPLPIVAIEKKVKKNGGHPHSSKNKKTVNQTKESAPIQYTNCSQLLVLATASSWVSHGNSVRPSIYGEKRAPEPTECEEEPAPQTNEQMPGNTTPVMNEYHMPCGYPHGESMCQHYIDQGFEQFYSKKDAGDFFLFRLS